MQSTSTNTQKTIRSLGFRTARAVGVLAAVAAVMAGPTGLASSAQAAPASGTVATERAALPPGVVRLNDGEPCPAMSLCLYRDYFSGPAYAIAEGYEVDLHDLPCRACAFGPTMADNVSSWNNRATWTAVLTERNGRWTPLESGRTLVGGPSEDKVVKVTWQRP
ncbi:peptidase inhibitor family I36 protein [Streptomyces sp. NPDC020096]